MDGQLASQAAASDWNSLEITKLVASLLTPLAIFFLGWMVDRNARRLDQHQWEGRQRIEIRLEVYKEVAPRLSDVLCFFTLRGNYLEIDPPRVLAIKQELDKAFYANEQLMGAEFVVGYSAFMNLCFSYWQAVDKSPKIKASREQQRMVRGRNKWESDWDELFVPEADATDPKEIYAAHTRLLNPWIASG